MKEKIYTIPLMDAFRAQDECPFCFIERNLEQHAIDFVLGSGASYMEDDVRAETDKIGFCRTHYKKMFDYGNRLGTGLILTTHFKKKNEELKQQIKMFSPAKASVLGHFKKTKVDAENPRTNIGSWVKEQTASCYICDYYKNTYNRYLDTFFELYRKNPEFRELFKNSKGFCIPHFADLVEIGDTLLSDKEKQAFYTDLFPLMEDNLQRVTEDLEWFCDKFDYKNKDADWKNSRDAIQRGMQKAAGGYPADPVYKAEK
ncbi:MAG TPA: hypothetical protein H9858_11040 [Candidatus Blautia stercoravium]|nr:hypothetical protein [Candidatus Blautia stercoravium]